MAHPMVDSTAIFQKDIFNGRVLFCTGGGSGICRAMTESIMRHGADAVILGRNLERITKTAQELSDTTGRRCIFAQADVRNQEQLRAAVTKCIDTFGRIDFVICGAAGNFLAPITGLSENAFKTVLEIDTLGTYQTIKATLASVRASKGSYIHVSATLHYRGTPLQAHVSAAKAGVDALSAVLAVEQGPSGVRSNVIAPGPIAGTEGMDRLAPQAKEDTGYTRTIPVARMGHVKDIANAAVFLFSDAASFISGNILVVDGASEHVRSTMAPYPDAFLDPEPTVSALKPRL